MSPLLRSIFDITEVFNQYASHDCDGAALCKKDLKNLLEREFGAVLQVRNKKKRKFLYWFEAMKFLLKSDQSKEWWLYIHFTPWQLYTTSLIHFWAGRYLTVTAVWVLKKLLTIISVLDGNGTVNEPVVMGSY